MSIILLMKNTFLLDCGWSAAILIALLQMATAFLPVGEMRDWTYYILVGGWAALVVLVPSAKSQNLRIALSLYAIAALSFYFLIPLVTWWFSWLWIVAIAVAWQWGKKLDTAQPLMWRAGLAWCIMCAFAVFGTLIYHSPWFAVATDSHAVQYVLGIIVVLLFTCPFIYKALVQTRPSPRWKPAWLALAYGIAFYLLILIVFRDDRMTTPQVIHHWKAYLEPADSVRAGGWLLWDVPNVYGFLVTLVIAALPTATTWQSLYLLNGTLIVAAAMMIFSIVSKKHPFILSLLVTICSIALLLPTTPDPRVFPSTGPLRFFWIYPLVGYIYYLSEHYRRTGTLPRFTYAIGNALWLIGALWSPESALFMTIVWVPSLILLASPQGPKHIAYKLTTLAAVGFATVIAIAAIYRTILGHFPDISLLTAYARAFAGGYAAVPITTLGPAPCWLGILFLMVMACRHVQNRINLAVCYACISALWAVTSYYIPFSEDFHLTGTLPVMVYVSAIMSLLDMPAAIKTLYEKSLLCLYSVIILATLAHLDPAVFMQQSLLTPVHRDITDSIPKPPESLQKLVKEAKIPAQANVFIISQPFTQVGAESHLTNIEGYYFHDLPLHPWLLSNTILAYDAPLSHDTYATLARRRAERLDDSDGWLIERKDNSLAHYPWIGEIITSFYRQAGTWENDEFRIIRFQKVTNKYHFG